MTPQHPACRTACRPAQGFTLVEVLVALAIVAIALLAGTQAASTLTRNAQRQSDIVLAQLCAENELVKARLSRQMPSVGDSTEPCEQAGRQFSVNVIVRPTPNPQFRRIDAQVFDADISILRISTIIGRN
jgi:general secretion pathway protein I